MDEQCAPDMFRVDNILPLMAGILDRNYGESSCILLMLIREKEINVELVYLGTTRRRVVIVFLHF